MLLEALIAIGIAGMFMLALTTMLLLANRSSDRAGELQTALWNTEEGVEAMQTMSFASLPTTSTGMLSLIGNTWTVGTNGPQTLPDGSTRTLRILNVARDASCNIVTSGGTVDPDSRYLESEVTWTDTAGRSHTMTQRTLRTNWEAPTGSCFATTQAGQVDFDIASAEWYGGKQLREIYMTNTGTGNAVIDKITITWNNAAHIDQLFIDSSKVWSAGGPGTPSGSQSSGVELNVQNFTISPGATVELNKGQFDQAMSGTTITITVTFVDGSSYSSPPINPF